MARIFITGSSQGLGLMTAQLLAEQGHGVVLHARSEARAKTARSALTAAEAILTGDVSTLEAMRDLAGQANGTDRFDAVVHNVGLGFREPRRVAMMVPQLCPLRHAQSPTPITRGAVARGSAAPCISRNTVDALTAIARVFDKRAPPGRSWQTQSAAEPRPSASCAALVAPTGWARARRRSGADGMRSGI